MFDRREKSTQRTHIKSKCPPTWGALFMRFSSIRTTMCMSRKNNSSNIPYQGMNGYASPGNDIRWHFIITVTLPGCYSYTYLGCQIVRKAGVRAKQTNIDNHTNHDVLPHQKLFSCLLRDKPLLLDPKFNPPGFV
jgi:hypothetical protein